MRFFLLLAVAAVATAAILPDGIHFGARLGDRRKVGAIFSGRRPGVRPGDLFRREADPAPFGEHPLARRQNQDCRNCDGSEERPLITRVGDTPPCCRDNNGEESTTTRAVEVRRRDNDDENTEDEEDRERQSLPDTVITG